MSNFVTEFWMLQVMSGLIVFDYYSAGSVNISRHTRLA